MGLDDAFPKTWAPLDRSLSAVRRTILGHPAATRWILAGPGAILVGLATMAAMPLWLPPGAAGVNNIAYPILLTPLLWALPFFYACLEENLLRGAAAMLGALLIQGGMVALALA